MRCDIGMVLITFIDRPKSERGIRIRWVATVSVEQDHPI